MVGGSNKFYLIQNFNSRIPGVSCKSKCNISSEVINSNGFYTVQSAASEPSGESGFLRTVVYFKRIVSGYQNIYDSYIKKDSTGNAVAYSGLHEEDNLYWKTGSVSSIDPSAKTVTISATDNNIHAGNVGIFCYNIVLPSGK